VRFQALPLFGLPHVAGWKTVGKRTKASSQEVFPGLAADNWVGVMSWRFKKGRKTVLSGLARSEASRIGRSKGRSSCTIAEGLKPVDRTPPVLFILPSADAWYHAPANVQLTASDEFSGVQSVRYGLDGGGKQPITNGSTFQIPSQGAHTVDAEATDVAGNTGTLSATVKVDGGPPSKPSLSRPFSVTQSAAPQFTWSASTDSGSGMRGYVLTIRKASDNSIVAFQVVGADTTSIPSPATLTDGETYTATVTAVDNTADLPWTADSDALTFRVDSSAGASAFSPASGTVLSGSANTTNSTISLDRVADKSTVTTDTVKLVRSDGTQPGYAVDCNSPCTQITVDPSSALPEGRYTLSLSGVKSADEGLTYSGSAVYAVPFIDDSNGVDIGGSGVCVGDATGTRTGTVNAGTSQPGTVSFDWSFSGGSGWKVFFNGTQIGAGGPGTGHASFNVTIPAGNNLLTLEFRSVCDNGTGTLNTDNVIATRVP
jgi:hypothetical protein